MIGLPAGATVQRRGPARHYSITGGIWFALTPESSRVYCANRKTPVIRETELSLTPCFSAVKLDVF